MQTTEWLQEDIDILHHMVLESVSQGKTREDAFKRYARTKGLKSVNAVRYKWITTSPSTAELTGEMELALRQGAPQTQEIDDTQSLHLSAERSVPPTLTNPSEVLLLKHELARVKSIMAKLRDKNRHLRKENRQLLHDLKSVQNRSSADKTPVVVVGAEGFTPENLAKFIHCTQGENGLAPLQLAVAEGEFEA